MRVIILPRADKFIESLNQKLRNNIETKLRLLSDYPNLKNLDVKKIVGSESFYRLRIGKYRVLFEIVNNKIIVYKIDHRKNIYRD